MVQKQSLFKIGVPKNFAKFTGIRCVRKKWDTRPATLLKKILWHRCFPMNFAKFLRISTFIEDLHSLLQR